jgi:hypothetical protein
MENRRPAHLAGLWERNGAYRVLGGDRAEEKKSLGYLDIDGRIILKCIFKKWQGRHGPDWSGSS